MVFFQKSCPGLGLLAPNFLQKNNESSDLHGIHLKVANLKCRDGILLQLGPER